MKDVYDALNDYLSDLSIDELVDIYNQIVLKGNQNGWHYIYSMYDFEDVVTQDRTAIDVIFELYDPIKRGLFNPNDEYFYFDRKDKIESFSDIMALECPIYIPKISEYIYDNDDDFGYEGIAKILSMFN